MIIFSLIVADDFAVEDPSWLDESDSDSSSIYVPDDSLIDDLFYKQDLLDIDGLSDHDDANERSAKESRVPSTSATASTRSKNEKQTSSSAAEIPLRAPTVTSRNSEISSSSSKTEDVGIEVSLGLQRTTELASVQSIRIIIDRLEFDDPNSVAPQCNYFVEYALPLYRNKTFEETTRVASCKIHDFWPPQHFSGQT